MSNQDLDLDALLNESFNEILNTDSQNRNPNKSEVDDLLDQAFVDLKVSGILQAKKEEDKSQDIDDLKDIHNIVQDSSHVQTPSSAKKKASPNPALKKEELNIPKKNRDSGNSKSKHPKKMNRWVKYGLISAGALAVGGIAYAGFKLLGSEDDTKQ